MRKVFTYLIFLIVMLNLPISFTSEAFTKQKPTSKQKGAIEQKAVPKQKSIIEKEKSNNEFSAIYIPLTSLVDQTKKIIREGGHSRPVNSVAFSPDGRTLASGSWDKPVILWDIATGNKIKTLSGHSESLPSALMAEPLRLEVGIRPLYSGTLELAQR